MCAPATQYALADRKARVRWNALGGARSLRAKLRVTDPVHRVITGETLEVA